MKESAAIAVERISDVIFSAKEEELSFDYRIFLLEVSVAKELPDSRFANRFALCFLAR